MRAYFQFEGFYMRVESNLFKIDLTWTLLILLISNSAFSGSVPLAQKNRFMVYQTDFAGAYNGFSALPRGLKFGEAPGSSPLVVTGAADQWQTNTVVTPSGFTLSVAEQINARVDLNQTPLDYSDQVLLYSRPLLRASHEVAGGFLFGRFKSNSQQLAVVDRSSLSAGASHYSLRFRVDTQDIFITRHVKNGDRDLQNSFGKLPKLAAAINSGKADGSYNFRLRVDKINGVIVITAKLWPTGAAEPSQATITGTDSDPIPDGEFAGLGSEGVATFTNLIVFNHVDSSFPAGTNLSGPSPYYVLSDPEVAPHIRLTGWQILSKAFPGWNYAYAPNNSPDATATFRASIQSIRPFVFGGSTLHYKVEQDGVLLPHVYECSYQGWGFCDGPTQLDPRIERTYAIVVIDDDSPRIHGIQTSGGRGINLSATIPAPPPTILFYGDSKTVGAGPRDSTLAHGYRLGKLKGYTEINRGVSGSKVMERGLRDAANWADLPVEPKLVVIEYGVNDIGTLSPVDQPSQQFVEAYTAMLIKILSNTQSTVVYVMGILPNTRVINPPLDAYNRAIEILVGKIQFIYGSRISFISTRDWLIPGTSDFVKDNFHPSARGYDHIVDYLSRIIPNP